MPKLYFDNMPDSDKSALAESLSVLRIDDTYKDIIISGFQVQISAGLNATISGGRAYIGNKKVLITEIRIKTFSASKDTYCFVAKDGTYSYIEVVLNDPMPAFPANSLLFSLVQTNLSLITRIDQMNSNVRLGSDSLSYLGVSRYNVAIGKEALMNNLANNVVRDNGLYNTAVGSHSMRYNTTGNHNSAVGFSALEVNTTGSNCTAIGEDSFLRSNANWQVGLGDHTGQNITGAGNIMIGSTAGTSIWGSSDGTTDRYNTVVGTFAGFNKSVNAGPFDFSTAIGHKAYIDESYICIIGDTNLQRVKTYGDFETLTIGKGFVCKSPNGSRYRITVTDDGTIITTSL